MDEIRISWSSLRTWSECKQRAKLVRTGKRSKMENQRNFLPGNVTDRVVRRWLMDPDRKPGQMVEWVPEQLEIEIAAAKVIKWKHVGDKEEVLQDCLEAAKLIEEDLIEHVTGPGVEIYADYSFKAPFHAARAEGGDPLHVTLNGFMDILIKDKHGRWWIFDVKHTKDSSYWKKTQGQMSFYAMAVWLIHGKQPSGAFLLQPLASPRVKPVDIERDALKVLAQNITSMANDIDKDEMPPRDDTTLCGWCSVQHACVKFKRVEGSKRVSLTKKTK